MESRLRGRTFVHANDMFAMLTDSTYAPDPGLARTLWSNYVSDVLSGKPVVSEYSLTCFPAICQLS